MPRYARIAGPNLFYHLMNRGIEKRAIFRKSGDYDKFMSYLSICNKKFDWSIYCYCIMPNHFHLLVRTRTHPLGHIMKSLQTSYGVYFNKKYKRVGPVFSGRFKSIICQEDSYFLQVSKYIHLNPVKAGLCNSPEDFQYSSFREYIEDYTKNTANFLLDRREMKRVLGGSTDKKARETYRNFVTVEEDLLNYNPQNPSTDVFGDTKFVTKFKRIAL